MRNQCKHSLLNLCTAAVLAIGRHADFAYILSKLGMTLDLKS
jgi:hypothetical protein